MIAREPSLEADAILKHENSRHRFIRHTKFICMVIQI